MIKRDRRGSGQLYGFTPLHYACASNDLVSVTRLFAEGVDPNIADIYGETCVHLAAQNGFVPVLKALINARADLNIRNQQGDTPLHVACNHQHTEAIKLLIESGSQLDAINNKHQKPMNMCRNEADRMLFQAAVTVALPSHVSVGYHGTPSDCFTPLMLASLRGDLESVRKHVREFPETINSKSIYGDTALHLSCEAGNEFVAACLIKAKADTSIEDSKGRTAFQQAADMGYPGIEARIRSLLGKPSFESIDCDTGDAESQLGYTPLQYACAQNSIEKVRELVSEGIDVNAKNAYGDTALHYAARNASVEAVKLLVEKGADVNSVSDSSGDTPLMFAIRRGNREIVNILIRAGADVDFRNSKGVNGKQLASQTGMVIADSGDREYDSGSASAYTPLMYACVKGDLTKVKELVSHSVSGILERNTYGDTALSYACLGKSLELVQFLISMKSDVNTVNS